MLAVSGQEFMRYDGVVKIVKDENLLEKVREAMPQIMSLYDKNGWEMGMFYLEKRPCGDSRHAGSERRI